MLIPWLRLRRIRQRATLRSEERRDIEAYLREHGAFGSSSVFFFKSFVRTWSAIATVVLLLTVGIGSYAYASDDVLPNTPLYPVRQALEQVETKLAVTPAQKEKVQRKLVERRKHEVQKLKELKKPVPVEIEKSIRHELRREFIFDHPMNLKDPAMNTTTIVTSTQRGERLHQEKDRHDHDIDRVQRRELRFATSTSTEVPHSSEDHPRKEKDLDKKDEQQHRKTREQKDWEKQH